MSGLEPNDLVESFGKKHKSHSCPLYPVHVAHEQCALVTFLDDCSRSRTMVDYHSTTRLGEDGRP